MNADAQHLPVALYSASHFAILKPVKSINVLLRFIFLVCAQAQGSLLTFGPERVVGVGMGSHLWPIPFSPIHLKVSDRKETQNLAIYRVLGTPGPRRCDS